ncbi:MAG: DEAD/DEAH box helicase, partial [Verrucomicrobia bacterium]|nr:DEAD/DEAH box helicase [Verrucomicrobiota bacterium]
CLKQNARQPREIQAPLSDYFALEACQTLFSLKLREWNYMVNHPERYFPASERLTDASRAPCPCFILAQDQNQVRAHIMQVHFGKMGFVESFGKDDGQEALRFLFTEILKHSEVPSDRIREDESVVLSWEEYNTLERYLAELPPSDLPRLLVPMREKLVQPIEEVSETDSSGDDVESASDEEPSYRRERDRGERPAKRRERSPAENPEQPSSLESFLSFNDLIRSRSSDKRTTRENDGVSSEAKRHRKNAYEAPEHEGAFVPLEEQLIPFPADVRSKRQRRGKEGEIPEVGSFAGLPSLNDDQAFAVSDNPYDTLNRTSIKKIKEAVAREVARESVVLRQIKPYSYPIVDKLSDMPAAKPAFSWTRALKPYQQETLQDLLRYDSHGLSKLLSLEMGLGKTYVFAEFLIDKIATSPSPQLHVVSAPVSVVGQVQQELSKLLLEASITAWQLTGKRPAGPQLWPQCKQLLDYANNHPDALKSVLRVLPYFKDAHVYGVPASNQFFSQPGLQGQLFSMIQEHLVEIETLLQ